MPQRGNRLVTVAIGLVLASMASGADPVDALGDPLPKGAKARLGTIRGGPLATPRRYSTAFLTPDGKALLVSGEVGPVLHDIATGQARAIPGFDNRADDHTPLAVSDDGKRAVTARGSNYLAWEVNSGQVIRTVTFFGRDTQHRRYSPVSLSGDGKVLAYVEGTSDLVVCEIGKDEPLARITAIQNEAVSLLLSPRRETAGDSREPPADHLQDRHRGPTGHGRATLGHRDRETRANAPGGVRNATFAHGHRLLARRGHSRDLFRRQRD